MHLTRSSVLAALMVFSGLASAEVRIEGPVEYGVFEGPKAELQSGERVLRRSNEKIQQTAVVPARLGTKFGMRYQLQEKPPRAAPDPAIPDSRHPYSRWGAP